MMVKKRNSGYGIYHGRQAIFSLPLQRNPAEYILNGVYDPRRIV